MKKVIVLGGGGYCGNVLIPKLIALNWQVTVFDIFWYGDRTLKDHKNLKKIKGDIRDLEALEQAIKGNDYLIHLACISNDSSFELNEKLSKSVNFDCFESCVKIAKKNKIKRFIFASSSSVYGVSDSPEVKEDHPLLPLTLYNKFKGECEPLLLKYHSDDFTTVIFRPATVCGYSPRQRLDLSVNILTNHAISNRKILVFGGDQLRPNLHIDDYVDAVILLLNSSKEKIGKEIFNLGMQNFSILEIAKIVKKVVEEEFDDIKDIPLEITPSNDNRSYHINSDKIKNIIGFTPKKTIQDAVKDLCNAFKKNLLPNSLDDDIYFNVKRMKNLKVE